MKCSPIKRHEPDISISKVFSHRERHIPQQKHAV